MFDTKKKAADELDALIKEQGLAVSSVGRQIAGDPNFVYRMRDPRKTVTTKTLDEVWRFILKRRGQMQMGLDIVDLDLGKD